MSKDTFPGLSQTRLLEGPRRAAEAGAGGGEGDAQPVRVLPELVLVALCCAVPQVQGCTVSLTCISDTKM